MTIRTLPFILASASPRRLQLLQQLGIAPTRQVVSGVDETINKNELPKDFCLRMAKAKATAVAQQHGGAVILAADTVVAMGRRVIAPPPDAATAKTVLGQLAGRRHRIITAMVLVDGNGRMTHRISTTRVKLKELNQDEISRYIATNAWQGRAGGLALDGPAAAFLSWLNGSPSGTIGLDLKLCYQLLKGVGLL